MEKWGFRVLFVFIALNWLYHAMERADQPRTFERPLAQQVYLKRQAGMFFPTKRTDSYKMIATLGRNEPWRTGTFVRPAGRCLERRGHFDTVHEKTTFTLHAWKHGSQWQRRFVFPYGIAAAYLRGTGSLRDRPVLNIVSLRDGPNQYVPDLWTWSNGRLSHAKPPFTWDEEYKEDHGVLYGTVLRIPKRWREVWRWDGDTFAKLPDTSKRILRLFGAAGGKIAALYEHGSADYRIGIFDAGSMTLERSFAGYEAGDWEEAYFFNGRDVLWSNAESISNFNRRKFATMGNDVEQIGQESSPIVFSPFASSAGKLWGAMHVDPEGSYHPPMHTVSFAAERLQDGSIRNVNRMTVGVRDDAFLQGIEPLGGGFFLAETRDDDFVVLRR